MRPRTVVFFLVLALPACSVPGIRKHSTPEPRMTNLLREFRLGMPVDSAVAAFTRGGYTCATPEGGYLLCERRIPRSTLGVLATFWVPTATHRASMRLESGRVVDIITDRDR